MPQLPALRFSNALLDFSPLSNAIDSNRRNALMQQDSARADEQLTMQREQFDYTKQRNQKQDQRSEVEWYGKAANAIQNMPENDPRRAAAWQGVLRRHGGQGLSPQEMDPITGPAMMAAQAGMYLDPRDSQMKDADLAYRRAQIGKLNQKDDDPIRDLLVRRLSSMPTRGAPSAAPGLQPQSGAPAYDVPKTGVMPISNVQSAAPQQSGLQLVADAQSQGSEQAQPGDLVNTPFGPMNREEARSLGGTMLLDPKYAAAGRAILDSIGNEGPSGISKPAQNKLDESTVSAASTLGRLNAIRQQFKPEFQQIPTRLKLLGASWGSAFGGKLSPEIQSQLRDFSSFKATAFDNFNQLLKELSGTAVSAQELQRQKIVQPNPGEGLFDGDDPTTFMSKIDQGMKIARSAMARMNYMRSKGLQFNKETAERFMQLKDVPAEIDKRGAEIERDLRKQNPKADKRSIERATRDQLRQEFGI